MKGMLPVERWASACKLAAAATLYLDEDSFRLLARQATSCLPPPSIPASSDACVTETPSSSRPAPAMGYLNGMLLPAGVTAEGQGLWGSIGWGTPACLGVAMAKTSGRTWMVTSDGSHQLTLNELCVMGRYGIKPVIFVLNNDIYGIEDVTSERGHAYDDLAPVNYHLLPEAFGCKGWLSAKVSTVAELDKGLDRIAAHDGAAYVEVMISNEESQPMSDAGIDRPYKLKTPPIG